MIWMIWRQHRGELLAAAILLAILGVLLLTHGVAMHNAFDRLGVAECHVPLPDPESEAAEACGNILQSFASYSNLPEQTASWLPFLPMVAGMLIGAPLLAREFEQGTWQLAWTQGVTRTRWLGAKLALVLGGVLVTSTVFAAGLTWWFEPKAPAQFTTDNFNHAVLVFPAYVLAGTAIGVLAGVVFKRVLVAAAVTIPVYLAVRLPIEFGLRPRYREPLMSNDPADLAQGWLTHDLRIFPGETPTFQFHPDSRFWEFQLIETAILLGITAILLLIAWRLTTSLPRLPHRFSLRAAPISR